LLGSHFYVILSRMTSTPISRLPRLALIFLLAGVAATAANGASAPVKKPGEAPMAKPSARVVTIYEKACIVCHEEGVQGAPIPGEAFDWEDRLSYGMQELYANTIEGMGVSMPPRGTCDDCTDAELKAVVDFMTGKQ
jgi:cytochrome c5